MCGDFCGKIALVMDATDSTGDARTERKHRFAPMKMAFCNGTPSRFGGRVAHATFFQVGQRCPTCPTILNKNYGIDRHDAGIPLVEKSAHCGQATVSQAAVHWWPAGRRSPAGQADYHSALWKADRVNPGQPKSTLVNL